MTRLARVTQSIDKLPDDERLQLFYTLNDALFPDSHRDIQGRVKDIREKRYADGFVCPHCGGSHTQRNGSYTPAKQTLKRQRHRCTDCAKTFSDTSFSLLAGTHYPDLWPDCLKCMVSGYSLRKIAARLGIHLSTAFYGRHKILNAIRSPGFDDLQGIVEADETFFLDPARASATLPIVLLVNAAARQASEVLAVSRCAFW